MTKQEVIDWLSQALEDTRNKPESDLKHVNEIGLKYAIMLVKRIDEPEAPEHE